MREEEKRRKSEEFARKKAERKTMKAAKEAEKAANKVAKEAEKAAKQVAKEVEMVAKEAVKVVASKGKQPRAGSKRKAGSEGSSANKRKKDNIDNTVFSDKCCVCLGSYEDDAETDRQWLQCKCLRWIHEDCVDYEDSSPDGSLCPLC